ncbi:MAG: FAD-dependent oxidoreductase [Kofleriaceae bacterium]|nr:FAD-dependent oxidoreductase [Myxococcales bacterium]MCB9565220.1 FAD-dependent oxidoreductase [Kofleriaceae bacterium]MCB9573358.1 FAD-dependent oxidoreductase [Kofleriaceae bacterium]
MALLSREIDVAIVGAGLSGLSAARALAATGVDVAVLEARDRVGGRTLSRKVGRDVLDLGGQWIGPTQDHVARLAEELGVHTFPQYAHGRRLIMRGGEVASYRGFLPKVPVLDRAEAVLRIAQLERLARQIALDAPGRHRKATIWDRMTVADYVGSIRRAGARDLLTIATEMVFAAEPHEISFLYFLYYLRAGGGLIKLTEVRGGAQERRFVEGAQALSIRMARDLGAAVHLDVAIGAIEQDGRGVTLRTSRGPVRARYAIVAIPPALSARVDLGAARTAARARVERDMPMGSVIKCLATYPRPFWRDAGLSGEAITSDGVVRATFDDSSHDGRQAALVAFVIGDAARRWSRQPAEARRAAVLADLVRLFGPAAGHPDQYVDQDWLAEPYSGGCYVGVMAPGVLAEHAAALREPAGRIHFAGTESATAWVGYFDGAISAGQRAAAELLERIRG